LFVDGFEFHSWHEELPQNQFAPWTVKDSPLLETERPILERHGSKKDKVRPLKWRVSFNWSRKITTL
jgi:hypothetical protein